MKRDNRATFRSFGNGWCGLNNSHVTIILFEIWDLRYLQLPHTFHCCYLFEIINSWNGIEGRCLHVFVFLNCNKSLKASFRQNSRLRGVSEWHFEAREVVYWFTRRRRLGLPAHYLHIVDRNKADSITFLRAGIKTWETHQRRKVDLSSYELVCFEVFVQENEVQVHAHQHKLLLLTKEEDFLSLDVGEFSS